MFVAEFMFMLLVAAVVFVPMPAEFVFIPVGGAALVISEPAGGLARIAGCGCAAAEFVD